LLPGGADEDDPGRGKTILAPGAPPSPGRPDNALAVHLEHGEVLAWWGAKERIQYVLVLITLGATAVALGLVSAFAPELWARPLSGLWAPLLALLSPTLFVLVREWLSRGALMVTDGAIVEVDRHGTVHRLPLHGIQEIRRDWLRGGVRLIGRRHEVRVCPELMDDARVAVGSRLRNVVRGASEVVDPLGWLP
jgi:hypothetical protein